jgi:hypothetical protein
MKKQQLEENYQIIKKSNLFKGGIEEFKCFYEETNCVKIGEGGLGFVYKI